MAEGWTRHLRGSEFKPYSAGTVPKEVDPLAVKVMEEAGVDISGQRSKGLDELAGVEFDYVITVCDSLRETCPIFPGDAVVLHRSFDDPPSLSADLTDKDEILSIYSRVRDEIRLMVENLTEILAGAGD